MGIKKTNEVKEDAGLIKKLHELTEKNNALIDENKKLKRKLDSAIARNTKMKSEVDGYRKEKRDIRVFLKGKLN